MRLIRSTVLTVLLGACSVPVLTLAAHAQIVITVGEPPPPLPIYEQPPIPAPGYIWTPGYWSFDDDYGYYWVPGTWVEAPRPGLLWTPGYWGYDDGYYGFHSGYWGEEVGFYGGVDYGYGYGGFGYAGGRWEGDHFFYNRTVNNISNVHITNVYNETIVNRGGSRVSFNGGQGGLTVRPTPQQMTFARAQHVPATSMQQQHVKMAQHDPALRESVNNGRPAVAATSRPNQFKGPGVVQATTAGARPAGQTIPQGKAGPGGAGPGGRPGADTGHALPGATNGRPLPNEKNAERPGQPGPGGTRMQTPGGTPGGMERNGAERNGPARNGTPKPERAPNPEQRQQEQRMQRPDQSERAPPRPERARPQQERMPQQERARPQQERMQAPQERMQQPRPEPRQQPERMAPRPEPHMQGGGGMERGGGGGGERGGGGPRGPGERP